MDAPIERETILYVIAGVNGAGKSSIIGELLRHKAGLEHLDPDQFAGRIQRKIDCTQEEANSKAWLYGKNKLEEAIRQRWAHAFETTLGGNTIPRLIEEAATDGFDVYVWFIGLSSPELHVARVKARVEAGGHPIPEGDIRKRWDGSRRNIVKLMPLLKGLKVYDNSEERDPHTGVIPAPKLLLHLDRGMIVAPELSTLGDSPNWAVPIITRAMQLHRETTGRDL